MLKKGQPVFTGELLKARALAMVHAKLTQNLNNKQLAEQFKVSQHTVERAMRLVREQKLLDSYRDTLFNDLVPTALSACKTLLEANHPAVVLEVLKGTNVLQKPNTNPTQESNDGDTLEGYIRIRRQRVEGSSPAQISDSGATASQALLSGSVEETAEEVCEGLDLGGLPSGAEPTDDPHPSVEGQCVVEGELSDE